MRLRLHVPSLIVGLFAFAGRYADAGNLKEDYVREPMPPGFGVVVSEIEGPVFVDAQGHTLYVWPKRGLRAGSAGEDFGKVICGNDVTRESAGVQSPYPGGFEVPELETRVPCTQVWPPVIAAADATPVGKWTLLQRSDGKKQWAYEKRALYTSVLDKERGDVLGGTKLPGIGEGGAERKPVGPDSNVPAQFVVYTTMAGRIVTLRDGSSVYTYDRDAVGKSKCTDSCLDGWAPIIAPSFAAKVGEWTTFERSPGVMQWAFRGRPVYRHLTDLKPGAQDGADKTGWRNLYVQKTPPPPRGFTLKPTIVGLTLGDASGMTVYRYVCTDDTVDQLACDHPDSPQVYRMTICGGGDAERCVKTFPYVIAPKNYKATDKLWGTMRIDPKTGRRTTPDTPGAINVWTLRNRPVYTFAGYRGYGDTKPDDIKANGWGEGNGGHNGFMAIVYRDISDVRDGYIGRGGGGF